MARISEQILEQIRNTADIIEIISGYVQLKKRGRNFFGLCPFHGEKTASFSVNPERQIYKCFGCGVGGGVINFIMEIEGLDFVNAVKNLATQYNIDIQLDDVSYQSNDLKGKLFDIHEKASNVYYSNFNSEEGKIILEHLVSRGLNKRTIKDFQLGYSLQKKNSLLSIIRSQGVEANVMKESGLFLDTKFGYIDRFYGRIIFSIHNASGKVSAFAGRTFESNNQAKYVNSPETIIYNKSKILYGLHKTKNRIRENKSVIVVEGYMDFLQLYQSGIENIVAVSGTAFTDQHAIQIKRFCNIVYLAYDGDKAGKAAAIRAGYVLLRLGLSASIVSIPDGIDPDDWIKEHGTEPFLNAVSNSNKLIEFHYNNYSSDTSSTVGKSEFINSVIGEIVNINNPVDRELHCKDLSDIVGVSSESIFQLLNSLLKRKSNKKKLLNDELNNEQASNVKNQYIENDLIRICFSKDHKIRKYIADNLKLEWLLSDLTKEVYDKVFIHLNSISPPNVDLIIGELENGDHRNEFVDIIFDIERLNPSLKFAEDCIIRIEQNHIDRNIKSLRNKLKIIESNHEDPIPTMLEIEELQKYKNSLNNQEKSSRNEN